MSMKRKKDPRHLARILAVQTLFSENFDKLTGRQIYSLNDLMDMNNLTNYDEELFDKLVNGVKENLEGIDKYITHYAPQWPTEQIKKVDLEILRIAIFEAFIKDITPPKVAIDEAIELGKEFGGDSTDKFINGVLGAILKKIGNNGFEKS